MSYELTDTERNAAQQLNADYRYDHFISKVAQHGALWILKDEQGLLLLQDEEETSLPVWPHPDYAKEWASGDLARYQPQSITLAVWLDRWVEGLTQDGISVAVFPLPDGMGIIEDAADLAEALQDKLSQQAAE